MLARIAWFVRRSPRCLAILLRSYAISSLLLSAYAERAIAAEIGCAEIYDGRPFPEEIARKNWPSGIEPVAGTCIQAFIKGEIVKGDFAKVTTFYGKNHPFLNSFFLLSPGGNVEESLSIGRLFRKYLINVIAPGGRTFYGVPVIGNSDGSFFCKGSECICASACALVWFGGVDRSGEIGLHRPRIDDPQFKALPPAEATVIYRRTLNEIEAYLRDMEVPRSTIDEMVATGSAEIRWVETDDLQRPPSFAEWEDATCGHFTADEHDTVIRLRAKETGPAPTFITNEALLTKDERMLLKFLEDKQFKYWQCHAELRNRTAALLSPP